MAQQSDIKDIDDIKQLVDVFYNKVREDNLLAPIFYEKIKDNWQPHLQRMYLFWNAALFAEKGYIGNPFSKHIPLNISREHFTRWLQLFNETIDTDFKGSVAEDAKWRANVMAENFIRRLDDIAINNTKPIA